ncbi:LuxE family acyl-protein synthetase [Paenibacillus sp. GSMTC-2017]|uniref:LuxE/PaaK family acyltransferase n=1 Tax=Paenibacillus sp. GSMTC-2017 TaxID=2794350 RepID=UPI0018D9B13B|nr:LuxE family acyl-protein synthetase [Paenibacillus sp. GSMTC-2017]MBH5318814.1 LuxE family acyl-protein synthetase [Paenibacillus sp. GSMTC-2017]
MSTMKQLFQNMKDLNLDPVSMIAASTREMFRWERKDAEEMIGYLMANNFKYHYEKNTFYRKICDERGVTPEQVQGFTDINSIPLIPVANFKQADSHLLMSKSLSEVEFEMRSTGTSGIPSLSRRDSQSVSRAVFGLYAMYRDLFQFSKGAGLFLFPSPEEMPEMGMVKVLNMFGGLFDATKCLVKRASFKPKEAIEVLQNWDGIHTRHIVGPPFLVYKLINYLKENNIRLKLDKGTKIINLGGWKRFCGMEIPREQYNQEIAEYLGIEENQVRDMYGLVESNILAIECEEHSKHVPPWVYFSVRDVKDLSQEVPQGRRGVLAIMDPISLAYPGFILTEDLVYLEKENECACGRVGQKVVYISRIAGAEVGCCAINLEKHMDEMEADLTCNV